jgi:hypothetical protein
VEVRKKETDEVQLRRDGALNQFISELSSNLHGRRYTDTPIATANGKSVTVNDESERKCVNVVDNSSENGPKSATESVEASDKVSDSCAASDREPKSSQSELLAKPSHFVTVIEVKESETATPTTTAPPKITTSATSSFKSVRSGYENVIIENNKRNSNLINDMDRSASNTTTSFTSSFNHVRPSAPPSVALLQDAKKKIPPR